MATTSRTRWQYRTFLGVYNSPTLNDELSHFGAQGWELVTELYVGINDILFTFRREELGDIE